MEKSGKLLEKSGKRWLFEKKLRVSGRNSGRSSGRNSGHSGPREIETSRNENFEIEIETSRTPGTSTKKLEPKRILFESQGTQNAIVF